MILALADILTEILAGITLLGIGIIAIGVL